MVINGYSEFRIIGPPGTGKTTRIAQQVGAAVRKGHGVVVASLTKAAAEAAAGKEMPIDPAAVGTLHSFAYRQLGSPVVADTPKQIVEWNKANPHDALSTGRTDVDDDNLDYSIGEQPGDEDFAHYNLLRVKRVPYELWPTSVQGFAQRWEAWKKDADMVDFTDMIEIGVNDLPEAPGNPSMFFVDEAQDMAPLEMALVRKWGAAAGGLVVVGDPDQCLYQWRGSDPGVFYEVDLPQENEQVLAKSYRVPKAVWAQAMGWINQDPTRRQVEYQPTDAEGDVDWSGCRWESPSPMVGEFEDHIADGKTVMVLASCSYMLRPLIAELRRQGLPFHNPYRKKRGDWNPLGERKGTSAVDRLMAFTQMVEIGEWTRKSLIQWTEICRQKNVLPGSYAKDWINGLPDTWVSNDDLAAVLTDEPAAAGMSGDLRWLDNQLLANRTKSMAYPIEVYEARGRETLMETPKIIVGTIHSVKGGEADVVYLFPDLSPSGMEEWDGDDHQRAAVFRLFYVGMTRARESLMLCSASGGRAVDF